MADAHFDSGGDDTTFAPVVLRRGDGGDFRLKFGEGWDDWDTLHALAGGDTLDGCYLNGHGLARLLYAARQRAGLPPEPDGMEYNSSADTCFVRFADLACAVESARLLAALVRDRAELAAVIEYAKRNGLTD